MLKSWKGAKLLLRFVNQFPFQDSGRRPACARYPLGRWSTTARGAAAWWAIPDMNKVKSPPFHDTNLFWSCLTSAIGIILTVVAAMKPDIRFLLPIAWFICVFPVWKLSTFIGPRPRRLIVTILVSAMIGTGLYGISLWLKPLKNRETARLVLNLVPISLGDTQTRIAIGAPDPFWVQISNLGSVNARTHIHAYGRQMDMANLRTANRTFILLRTARSRTHTAKSFRQWNLVLRFLRSFRCNAPRRSRVSMFRCFIIAPHALMTTSGETY